MISINKYQFELNESKYCIGRGLYLLNLETIAICIILLKQTNIIEVMLSIFLKKQYKIIKQFPIINHLSIATGNKIHALNTFLMVIRDDYSSNLLGRKLQLMFGFATICIYQLVKKHVERWTADDLSQARVADAIDGRQVSDRYKVLFAVDCWCLSIGTRNRKSCSVTLTNHSLLLLLSVTVCLCSLLNVSVTA